MIRSRNIDFDDEPFSSLVPLSACSWVAAIIERCWRWESAVLHPGRASAPRDRLQCDLHFLLPPRTPWRATGSRYDAVASDCLFRHYGHSRCDLPRQATAAHVRRISGDRWLPHHGGSTVSNRRIIGRMPRQRSCKAAQGASSVHGN